MIPGTRPVPARPIHAQVPSLPDRGPRLLDQGSRAQAAMGRRSLLKPIGAVVARRGTRLGASPPPASGGATIARSSSIGSTDPWTPRGSIPWTTSSAATAETTSSGSPSTPNTSIAGPSFRPASGEFWRASKSTPCARARCCSPMPGWFPTSRDPGSPPCGANCAIRERSCVMYNAYTFPEARQRGYNTLLVRARYRRWHFFVLARPACSPAC